MALAVDGTPQGRGRLDQVRNDPRLKNSPIGGVLDAFLSKGAVDGAARREANTDDDDDRRA